MRLKFTARHCSGARKNALDPQAVVGLLEEQHVTFLPMTVAHAAARLDTPLKHKDPFDELLLLQAQAEGLRLMTIDRQLAKHPLAVEP